MVHAARDLAPRVRVRRGAAGLVEAQVAGEGRPLQVTLRRGEQGWEPLCSCLVARGEWCVHSAAVALAQDPADAPAPALQEPRPSSGESFPGRNVRIGAATVGPTYRIDLAADGALRVELRAESGETLEARHCVERLRAGLADAAELDSGLFSEGESGDLEAIDLQALASLVAMGEICDDGRIRVASRAAGGCLAAMAGTARMVDRSDQRLLWSADSARVEIELVERERCFHATAAVGAGEAPPAGRPVGGIPAWALIGRTIHPLDPAAARLAITLRDGARLSDDEAGRLLFGGDELPRALVVHGPSGQRLAPARRPRPIVRLEAGAAEILVALTLDYGGIEAAPRAERNGSPNEGWEEPLSRRSHVGWVVGRSPGENLWVPRDGAAEQLCLQALVDAGLALDRKGQCRVRGDRAVDLVNRSLGDELGAGWSIEEHGEIDRWRLLGPALELEVAVREGADDQLVEIEVQASADGRALDFERLRAARQEGLRYLPAEGSGQLDAGDPRLDPLLDVLDELDLVPLPAQESRPRRFRAPRSRLGLLPPAAHSHGVHIGYDQRLADLAQGLSGTAQSITDAPHPGLRTRLRPYQAQGVAWMSFLAEHRLGGVLADDMGLGKTVQALALLLDQNTRLGPAPCLIAAPASVVLGWRDQAAAMTPDLRLELLSGRTQEQVLERARAAQVDLVVCSFAGLRLYGERLAEIDWRTFIVDEAQFLKNENTESARCARAIRAESTFALTGTPIENHLGELRAIVELVVPGLLGSREAFRRRFAEPIAAGGERATQGLQRRLRPFLLRRVKDEVAPDLPEKIEVELRLPLPPGHEAAYRQIAEQVRSGLRSEIESRGLARSGAHVLAALTRLRQAACHPGLVDIARPFSLLDTAKSLALEEQLPEIVEEGHRAVLFSSFTSYLDRIEELLAKLGIDFVRLDGSTPREERGRRIERFQSSGGPPLFLISLRAGGTGLNLTRADYVFHLDPWWNPAVESQATDRAHRIGRIGKVIAYKLIAAGTIEQRILELQRNKRDLVDRTLGAAEVFGAELTLEELRALVLQENGEGR